MEKLMATDARVLTYSSIDWNLINERLEDIHHRIRRAAKCGERMVSLPIWIVEPQYEPVCERLRVEGYALIGMPALPNISCKPYVRW